MLSGCVLDEKSNNRLEENLENSEENILKVEIDDNLTLSSITNALLVNTDDGFFYCNGNFIISTLTKG